ncbi:hypothetical protein B0H14DRAFT_2579059 [Mycena olivaceomarginata]|nr:hypothetical protein B0H14DRAFT_2579059 [Mycena olivaceomarginata]
MDGYREGGWEWGLLYHWGVNRVLSVITSLYFWGCTVRSSDPVLKASWEAAVGDAEGMVTYYEKFNKKFWIYHCLLFSGCFFKFSTTAWNSGTLLQGPRWDLNPQPPECIAETLREQQSPLDQGRLKWEIANKCTSIESKLLPKFYICPNYRQKEVKNGM